jgi:uncharacterized protein (TIGR02266 family)
LKENRKFTRVAARMRCWCEGQNVTFYARIGNLSEGGLFLRTSTPLEEGTRTVVRFAGCDEGEFSAEATVVWARGQGSLWSPGMGMRFEELDEAALETIRRIITRAQKAGGDQESEQ